MEEGGGDSFGEFTYVCVRGWMLVGESNVECTKEDDKGLLVKVELWKNFIIRI